MGWEVAEPVDDLGLLDTLAGHCARFTRHTGVAVRLDAAGLDGRRFPASVEVTAYRLIQEALTNVARHAHVGHARGWLGVHGTTLEGGVEDAGAGCDPARLESERSVGMRERAQILGGRLTVVSVEGQDTRVTFELPLPHRADGPGRASSTLSASRSRPLTSGSRPPTWRASSGSSSRSTRARGRCVFR